MNERNVESLRIALVATMAAIHKVGGGDMGDEEIQKAMKVSRYLAIGLAGVGVLIPSALTDQECLLLRDPANVIRLTSQDPHPCVTALERIAKGETA